MLSELVEAIKDDFKLNWSKNFDLEIKDREIGLKFYQLGMEYEYLHLNVGISRLFDEPKYVLCGHAFYDEDDVVINAHVTCSNNIHDIVEAILKESSHHYMGRLGLHVLMERRVSRSY
ncbi:hypothetical protein [Bacillus thuringiensis]|nr:hypothetical protein [Bacillus thuringiensis]